MPFTVYSTLVSTDMSCQQEKDSQMPSARKWLAPGLVILLLLECYAWPYLGSA